MTQPEQQGPPDPSEPTSHDCYVQALSFLDRAASPDFDMGYRRDLLAMAQVYALLALYK